ncbi:MAG TPA: alanine--tRNA ligase [Bryobacterales bacterium]|nr:alanine--tRNA ligase [Bryobacterales bacterium]
MTSYLSGDQIRAKFLAFFEARGHRVVRSSSLVPANDPTLLFTNAGMNQFKDVFLGREKRNYTRAASAQKCVRAGGKHNDLENVGRTRRHHTFFEMLGNFSFGDYFKREAIDYAWTLVTGDFGLPKDRLYVTVFREDDDAARLWEEVAHVPSGRIFRCDEKDNFWAMGETGPCGPCSEIHYDFGPAGSEWGHADCPFPCECGRYVEIWNLVFMQFNRDAAGVMTPLPSPSIDTGMGLERVAAILQGKLSNYETDLLRPIIDRAAQITGRTYGEDEKTDVALRILADHSRATAFLIHDGVLPANEGRGYVLRKIMRRAMRHGRMIGMERPFLYELTGFVAEIMKTGYPELLESVGRVARVVKEEEQRYAHTFVLAERVFEEEVQKISGCVIPGSVSFKLYDTYGLALDEQEEMARERNLQIDREGFERAMSEQRARARASWKGAVKAAAAGVYSQLHDLGPTKFEGYDSLTAAGCRVLALVAGEQIVDSVPEGARAGLILDRTPFYAEAGGQVGDKGTIFREGVAVARVEDVVRPLPGLFVHKIAALAPLHTGDLMDCQVADRLRRATMRNHTATHLLHAALRQVLGPHVKQAGSVVEPGRLRFDFTHYAAMDRDEIDEVERLVNEEILKNTGVVTDVMDLESAIATGAMALFGEKYGERVRVVQIPGFSKELCGGTHVRRTGDIGLFKIVSESSISAGVRRIEAITGEAALEDYRRMTQAVERIAAAVRASEPELVESVERLIAREREMEREMERLKSRIAQSQLGALVEQARTIKDVKVLAARVEGVDRTQMRSLADSLRNKLKSCVVVLSSAENGNVAIVSAVTKDLAGRVHAGKIAGAVAEAVGGKGGGRPDMAEAGGKDAAALPGALEKVYGLVESML